jgi:hypothetical protein
VFPRVLLCHRAYVTRTYEPKHTRTIVYYFSQKPQFANGGAPHHRATFACRKLADDRVAHTRWRRAESGQGYITFKIPPRGDAPETVRCNRPFTDKNNKLGSFKKFRRAPV